MYILIPNVLRVILVIIKFMMGKRYPGQFDLFFSVHKNYFSLDAICNVAADITRGRNLVHEFFHLSAFLVFVIFLLNGKFVF